MVIFIPPESTPPPPWALGIIACLINGMVLMAPAFRWAFQDGGATYLPLALPGLLLLWQAVRLIRKHWRELKEDDAGQNDAGENNPDC